MTVTDATATHPAQPAAALREAAGPTPTAALHLLTPAAVLILLISLLLLVFGPSESLETGQWLLAFAVALPVGIVIADRQAQRLDEARAAWAIAAAIIALSAALIMRRTGTGDTLRHALVMLAAAGALAAPWLIRRVTPGTATGGYASAMVALVITVLLFIPDAAMSSNRLVTALVLAAIALTTLLATTGRELRSRRRLAVDIVLVGLLASIVMSVPDINPIGYILVKHHDFYLGPVNAIIHGRQMLDGTWSQYGVGVMDALRLAFTIVPSGYGGLALIVGLLTAAQYALVYATLRMAIRSQLLVAIVLASEVVAHILGLDVSYLAVPSTSPLRFGLPYLVIALAVLGAHRPSRVRTTAVAQIVVVAVSAVWSFETFIYTGAAYALIVIVTQLAAGPGALRRIARQGLIAGAAAIVAVLLYTGVRVLQAGAADWGPYLEYLRLYSVKGFGQLPITFFSLGPVMGGVIFLSVAGTIHLARTRSSAAEPEQLAALAGFSGAAVAFFTYYLGRSHPENLLHILLPTVVLGGLWAALLLQARPSPARIAGLAAILTAAAMLAALGWPTAKIRWLDSALAQGVPYADGQPAGQGRSLGFALRRMWNQPVFDPRATSGAALLAEHLAPGAPALVLTEPDLSTEILTVAHRRNLIPINNAIEDDLLDSSDARVRAAARRVPAETLMLTTPPPAVPGKTGALGGNPLDFVGVQVVALDVLHERFAFRRVGSTPDGLQLVRLRPRSAAS